MTNGNNPRGSIYSANDGLDINELASLNEDISPEFIEQLQNQLAQTANSFAEADLPAVEKDDSELFEEVITDEAKTEVSNDNLYVEDDFMKKFKAKKNQQNSPQIETKVEEEEKEKLETPENAINEVQQDSIPNNSIETVEVPQSNPEEIKTLTSGNIIEKPATAEQLNYNESLDFLDNNVKYSKYVIYIDPQNKEFIESLTVKERKNLINRILREQDDIAITKRRLNLVQTVIKHVIVSIVTVSISIPLVYWIINSSLEASIDNYRRSQTIFKTLYKEKGKIQSPTKR
ncbi:hypothetical protein IJ384_06275 [bacterium]|nr:hypothetical protein [bacterium]